MSFLDRIARRNLNLQSRFAVSFSLLALGILIPILIFIEKHQSEAILNETVKRGIAIGKSIRAVTTSSLLAYDYLALQQAADNAVEEGISYVIITDKEGIVAGVGGAEMPLMGAKLEDSVGVAAHGAREILVQETVPVPRSNHNGSNGTSAKVLDIAVPVFVEGSATKWGTVRVGLSLASVERERRSALISIGAIAVLAMIASIVGAKWLAKRITVPVNKLVEATIEMAQGNLHHRICIQSGDELEKLSNNFNNMASQIAQKTEDLASALKQLADLNRLLELKVEERTRLLAESEEKYRVLVENSPDPHLILLDGQIVYFNKAFVEACGRPAEKHKSERSAFLDLIPQESRNITKKAIGLSLEGETHPDHEIKLPSTDGMERTFVFRSRRIKFLEKPAVQVVLVDVTERKKLQEQVVQYERLRALGEMAGGVAHDFNNLLGIILGRAQLMQAKLTDEKSQRSLKVIAKAAVDGGEIVKRIQEFARVRKERNFSAVNVCTLIHDVIEITKSRWKNEAQAKGVRYEIKQDLQPTPVTMANESEIREVLTNIIFNAIDAMPDGGTLTLGAKTDGDEIVLSISDTGTGMPEEVKGKIFDPFFSTKGSNGMGLGLSTAYGVVKRHKGRIEFESQVGKGSTFFVRLPVTKVSHAVKQTVLDNMPARKLKILVIDDEPGIAELLEDILVEAGHKVETAGGGKEGLEKFARGGFQAVLTDLGMPDMSGWEVAEAVRARDADVIVGLVTGWGASIDPEKIERMAIDFLLNKPFQTRDVLEKIASVLMKKNVPDAAPTRSS